jgi:hypothetical protein
VAGSALADSARFHHLPDLVRDLADGAGRNIDPIQLPQGVLDVSGGDTSGIQPQDLLFQLVRVAAVFRNDLGFEVSIPVPRHLDFDISVGGAHFFVIVAVAAVARVAPRSFVWLVTELIAQFRFQHLFQGIGKQPGKDPIPAEEIIHVLGLGQRFLYPSHGGHLSPFLAPLLSTSVTEVVMLSFMILCLLGD